MERIDTDVFVSGGGIAGLVAAAAFARQGLRVTLADPAPPPTEADAKGSDLRSTAFLSPARDLLEDIGLWSELAPHACALEALRVVDCAGSPPAPVTDRTFRADDLGASAFGWNVPNWLSRKHLTDMLRDDPNVDLRLGNGFASLLTRDTEALVGLTDGTGLRARLVVAADGRASPVRAAAGIDVTTKRYGQNAFAFVVTHALAHENVSTELYLSGGAFTLVPLPDHDGQPASAVVWMNDAKTASDLAALDDADFAAAATERSCSILGRLTLVSPRRIWPIITQEAERLTARRTALIAEAAHVLPPIGAQGLNTSLQDVASLAALVAERTDTLGDGAFLKAFADARARDIHVRAGAIDLYNRICKSDAAPVQALRSLGLRATHDIAPLRRTVMRAGLGG